MADMFQEQEKQVKKLKRLLEGWRMALLPLKSIILWEQQWHPCVIIGSVSFLYLLIWLLDLNTLTTIALLGILLNFIDFIIPVISNSLYGPSAWTGQKEKMFEEICRSIVLSYNNFIKQVCNFYSLRETGPYMYYIISISMLITLAWITSTINNIFLFYILSVVLLLWPGVQHRGIINAMLSMVNLGPKTSKLE
ncbi:ADP-ribosylation factor-like protein 6-interacting protein 1 [Amyelois transitella]|uniref:ADP-ribosylation factor-like protein 6-interacting protein 1 n=1 Tax=Amyelois transitella TaxID=680683 RepID=UPI0029900357|nr:ADP-ribosylation factor-like protein 6-interacting protein 1 [Amyelois transitella]